MFAAARAANPKATLLINDFNLSDRYAKLIADCLDAGVPIDAIGLQTHQHQGYMGKEKLEEIIKRFEVLGLPLHFTENTLVSGHIMPSHIVDLNDYQIPENLIHREWHTSEKIRTDENGIAVLYGFKGTYTLTGEEGCTSFHLGSNEDRTIVTCPSSK